MIEPPPTVTVVTVVLNGARHLQDCLTSVSSQRGIVVEHVVIDGGSTDGCVGLLREWSDRLAFWSSEPDKGISDGMNKGIQRATGEWILFLHADDFLPEQDSLAKAVQCLDPSMDAAAFPILFGTPPNLRLVRPRPVGLPINLKLGMSHQGILTRRELFLTNGLHDLSYRIAMDYDFYLRAHRRGAKLVSFPSPTLSVMRDTGISSRSDWPSLNKRFLEERSIHFRHATGRLHRLAYRAYWLVYLPYRRLRAAVRA